MINEKTIKLFIPIQYGDKATNKPITLKEITCKRLKVKHLRKIKKELPPDCSETEEAFKMISLMADIPEEAMDEMDMADLKNVMDEIAPFLGSFPEGGKKVSTE